MQGEATRSRRGAPVALLMGLGGAAAAASALLTWANLTVAAKKKKTGGTGQAKSATAKALSGIHVLDGQVIVGLGLALIVAAVLYLLVRSPAFRTLTAGVSLALGLGI